MQTEEEVLDAQTDLIGKVCEYLVRRLALYANNISTINREGFDPIKREGFIPINHEDSNPTKQESFIPIKQDGPFPTKQDGPFPNKQEGFIPTKQQSPRYYHHYVTLEGWSTLFNAEPLAHGRRVCSYLYDVFGSTKEFWRGCVENEFIHLLAICRPKKKQPQNLLRKHFLFFRYLFAYLNHIETVVQRVPFSHFDELGELYPFLNLLVATQFLLCDLLDMGTTPIGKRRTKFRDHADILYTSVDECVRLKGGFDTVWRHARGTVTTEFVKPDSMCENGQFFVLGMPRTSLVKEPTYGSGQEKWY